MKQIIRLLPYFVILVLSVTSIVLAIKYSSAKADLRSANARFDKACQSVRELSKVTARLDGISATIDRGTSTIKVSGCE